MGYRFFPPSFQACCCARKPDRSSLSGRDFGTIVVPLLNANRQLTVFQQDNARCHTARVCADFLQEQQVNVLPWPAKSPDLSPIEHLWDVLDRRVRRRQPATLAHLELFLEQEWNAIPQNEIQTLIRSMRRRCTVVRDANGGHTLY